MRSDIAFAIVSYKRAGKVKTLHMLECYGVPKDQIFIFVQTDSDKLEYEDEYSDRANVVCMKASNCAGNRNNALTYLRSQGYKYILLMDDDVSNLMRMVPSDTGKTRFKCKTIKLTGGGESRKEFDRLIQEHVEIIEKGATVVAAYGESPMNLANRKRLRKKLGLTRGTYMLFGKESPLFNQNMPCCDDFELSARIVANGGQSIVDETVCLSTVSVKETASDDSLGGCAEYYNSDANAIVDVQRKYIIEPYKGIVGYNLRGGGDVNRYYSLFLINV